MPVTMMCSETEPNAVDVSALWANSWSAETPPERRKLYVKTEFVGRVISTRERNMHDDSDFFVTVWDDALNAPRSFEYASTRGWSYPNHAEVDATPETLAKYVAYIAQANVKAMIENDKELSVIPARHKLCKVVKGRKIAKGQVVKVLRVCAPVKYSQSRFAVETVNCVVCFTDAKGVYTQLQTNIDNLEVINPDQYLSPASSFEAEALRLANGHRFFHGQALCKALSKIGNL